MEQNFTGKSFNKLKILNEPIIHIGDEIRIHLNKQKRSVMWLADEINCDQSNLTKQLKKHFIHLKLLFRISEAMGVNFFSYYCKKLKEKHNKVIYTKYIGNLCHTSD